MELINELLSLKEAATPVHGWLAVFNPNGVDVDSYTVFKKSSEAKAHKRKLTKELDGSDMYVEMGSIDNHHVIMVLDHREDSDDVSLMGFSTSKEELEERLDRNAADDEMYGFGEGGFSQADLDLVEV